MPLKVLLLTTSFPRRFGDWAGAFVFHLGRAMARSGAEVRVLAPAAPGLPRRETQAGMEVVRFSYTLRRGAARLAYGEGILENLNRDRLCWPQVSPFIAAFAARAIDLARGCDLVNSHWLFPGGAIGALVSRALGVRHVATLHSGDVHLLARLPGGGAAARFVARNSDAIVATSGFIGRRFLRLADAGGRFDDKVRVVYGGADHVDGGRPPAVRREVRRLLYLGRLVGQKGVDLLIDALASHPGLHLTVAGEGSEGRALARAAASRGVEAAFVGPVGPAVRDDLLQACDALALPSRRLPSGRTEGLPLVVLEALARSRPVLAADVGGVGEIVRHGANGVLVAPGSAREMARGLALLRALAYPELARRARESVAGLTWRRAAAEHLAAALAR